MFDASIVAGLFLGEAAHPRVAMAMEQPEARQAFAPNLFFFEIRNPLVVNERRGGRRRSDPVVSFGSWRGCPFDSIPRQKTMMSWRSPRAKPDRLRRRLSSLGQTKGLPLATLDRALEKAAIAEDVALFGG